MEVQQAFDYCRVIGNNAVHSGKIGLLDNTHIAHSLFEMIDIIVEYCISKPKKVQDLYKGLPADALAAIEKRDSKVENGDSWRLTQKMNN